MFKEQTISYASKPALIPAAEWFGGGRRVPYDPDRHRVLTAHDDMSTPHLMVFERVVGAPRMDAEGRWMTLLPGFPDGSYGYAYVNALLGDELVPRLYLEYVGQGDSDKPRNYAYSTIERADLVEAQWQAHEVRRTFVVAFDYSSLVVLELLARQEERIRRGEPLATRIESVFIANGGLFADAHSHPWQTTPLLKTPLGALSMQFAQRSPALFARIMRDANLFSPGYGVTMAELREEYEAITRRDGAAFLHHGASFVDEHQAHATRWDLARLYHALSGSVEFCIAGSTEDPYEPRQIAAARAAWCRWSRHSDVSRWSSHHLGASRSARRCHPRARPGMAPAIGKPPGIRYEMPGRHHSRWLRLHRRRQMHTTPKVALVTGASSGFGQATAARLSAQGFRVFGTSRAPTHHEASSRELLPLDVNSETSVQTCIQTILECTGRIDLLVNNAGFAQAGALKETSLEEARAQFDTNVFGVHRLLKAVLPVMQKQGGGQIITVSSLLGVNFDIPWAQCHHLRGWSVPRTGWATQRVVLFSPTD